MKKTHLINVEDSNELFCGNCKSIIYGYDEIICPSCSSYIDMDNETVMTEEQFKKIW